MAKHKYIETPEIMWELFLAYKQELKGTPFKVKDWVGKDGYQVEREKEKPLTMEGFECYVAEHTAVTYPDLTEYFECRKESYKAYFPIITRIKKEIRRDQIEGGMAMVYHNNLTARINNIKEQVDESGNKEVTIKVKYEQRDSNITE